MRRRYYTCYAYEDNAKDKLIFHIFFIFHIFLFIFLLAFELALNKKRIIL